MGDNILQYVLFLCPALKIYLLFINSLNTMRGFLVSISYYISYWCMAGVSRLFCPRNQIIWEYHNWIHTIMYGIQCNWYSFSIATVSTIYNISILSEYENIFCLVLLHLRCRLDTRISTGMVCVLKEYELTDILYNLMFIILLVHTLVFCAFIESPVSCF